MFSPKLSGVSVQLNASQMQNLRWLKRGDILESNRAIALWDARLDGFGAINARIVAAQALGVVKKLLELMSIPLLSMAALPFRRKP